MATLQNVSFIIIYYIIEILKVENCIETNAG